MMDKKKMLQLKKFLLIAMGVMFILYIGNKLALNDRFDSTHPEIQFEEELLKVSVDDMEEVLLKGVKATDKKDGDITDSVIIESMSNMLDDYQRIVTYVAFDDDNHVGKAERRIPDTDYRPIRFSLTEPVNRIMSSDEETQGIFAYLKAEDCLDGDISNEIVIANQEYAGAKEGYLLYYYTFKVTSSSGEIATITMPIKSSFDAEPLPNAEIVLKENLIYVKVGENVNPKDYLKGAMIGVNEYNKDDVEITTDLDTSKPGVYAVTYSLSTEDGTVGCDMIVVVEG